jgi:hypothetical protein
MAVRKMHQTTVRFGADLWEALEDECAELGVSIAQFVRESALARLVYLAGRRGDPAYDHALGLAGATEQETGAGPGERPPDAVATALERSAAESDESSALWAQGWLARRRAQELRDEIGRRRHEH